MTCAKTRVRVMLTHPDGRSWTGENLCRNPQAECPRTQGEDYTKCRTVCDQVGHAELQALQAAGEHARGCTATLEGHTYYCMDCQHALFKAGVVALRAPGGQMQGTPAAQPVAWRWKYGDTDHHPWVVMDFPPPKGPVFRLEPLFTHGVMGTQGGKA